MKSQLSVRVLMLLGLWLAGGSLGRAEVYGCLTWLANSRTIVEVDSEYRPRCSGMGQVRVATIQAEPYESVELDQNTGFITATYIDPYSDWSTYLSTNSPYGSRYRGSLIFSYLSGSLSCQWSCPTPYDSVGDVTPWFDWETHGGLPYTASGAFSGYFYFY
jgi:hypothetical protein